MKNLIFMVLCLIAISGFSQNQKFVKAIQNGKKLIGKADTITSLIAAANYFQRIAQNEKTEWLPNYYQGQALTFAAIRMENEERETYLLKALECIQTAEKLGRNTELVAMEGFIQMMRLTVDPVTRGRTLSPTILALFQEALRIDANNPRALLFMGQMEFGTAQFFWSDTQKACEYIQKAMSQFDTESSDDTIFPNWGQETAQSMMKNCSK